MEIDAQQPWQNGPAQNGRPLTMNVRPIVMESLILRTQLLPEECRTRLQRAAEVDVSILTEMKFRYGVIVNVQDGRIWLRLRRPLVSNPLSPWLLVLCRPTLGAQGTLVEIRLQDESLAKGFTLLASSLAAVPGGIDQST